MFHLSFAMLYRGSLLLLVSRCLLADGRVNGYHNLVGGVSLVNKRIRVCVSGSLWILGFLQFERQESLASLSLLLGVSS